jgi:hypothetical protein
MIKFDAQIGDILVCFCKHDYGIPMLEKFSASRFSHLHKNDVITVIDPNKGNDESFVNNNNYMIIMRNNVLFNLDKGLMSRFNFRHVR